MSEIEKCNICGSLVEMLPAESLRETMCPVCRGSKRNRDLAKVIVETFSGDNLPLSEELSKLKKLFIYEAQSYGPIHDILKKLPNYICSEYFYGVSTGSMDKSGIRCEDLQKLTFPNNTFDLIITQDVLEHIPIPEKAFSEINRVLKPNGVHIFTVPIHEGRKTLKRVRIDERGNPVNLLPQVYHGDYLRFGEGALVYTDFGDDLIDFLKSKSIPTEIACYSKFYDVNKIPNVDVKEEYEFYRQSFQEKNLLKYFKYNSIILRSMKSMSGNVKPSIISIFAQFFHSFRFLRVKNF